MAIGEPKLVLQRVTPGRTYISPPVERGDGDSVIVLLFPSTSTDTGSLITEDSPDAGSLFTPTTDTQGNQPTNTGATYYKYTIGGVANFVRVQFTPTAGTWDAWIIPIRLPGLQTISATIGAVTQGAGAATSANAWWTKSADGSDPVQGSTTDAAVTGDTGGSHAAKLRGLNKLLADVWDNANHFIRVRLSDAAGAILGTAAAPVRVDPTGTTRQPISQQQALDYDSGAGTVTTDIVGIALPASGGPVAGGTATNPIRTDPTGTTTQPSSNAASSQADGHSATIGATADAAVTTNAAGTLSAKLRGIVAILADVWDSTNHFIKVRLSDASGAILGTAGAPVRTDPTGTTSQPVVGNVANAAADSGNPVKVAAVYRSSAPTYADGQRADLLADVNGRLQVAVTGSVTSSNVTGNAASGGADTGNPIKVGARYNSTLPTVTDGQRVDLQANTHGGLLVELTNSAGTEIGTNANPVRTDPTGTTKQPITVAAGDDATLGNTTDAAVTTNTTGTVSGKLRGLVAILADVWDSTNHFFKVRLSDASGAILGTAAAPVRTDPTGTTTQPVSLASLPALATGSNTIGGTTDIGSSTLANGQVSVTTTAQLVASRSGRRSVSLRNLQATGGKKLYYGASGVSTSTGDYLAPGEEIELSTAAAVHGVSEDGTTSIAVAYRELY